MIIKIIKFILMSLGVLFIAIIVLVAFVVIKKPYGIDILKTISVIMGNNVTSSYDHPYFTTQQEAVLESIGVDTKKIPEQITPAIQQCAVGVLGQKRADEIASGSMPNLIEIVNLKKCIE